jgi:hypothetical protein
LARIFHPEAFAGPPGQKVAVRLNTPDLGVSPR